jgi:HSP20 family protein
MSVFNDLIATLDRLPARRRGGEEAQAGVRPAYQVAEAKDAYGLTVHLPGVAKDGLELTAGENQIRIFGRRAWKQPEGWTALYRESDDAPFELVLDHDNSVDPEKIHAELADGVLRVSLPKSEALQPRKIAVS